MTDPLTSSLSALGLLAVIDLGMYVLKILAVAGGAAVGAIGGGLLLRLIAKVSFGRKAPHIPLRVVQALGATGLGVVVYCLAFRTGGSGLGGDGLSLGGNQGTSLSADTDAPKTNQELTKTKIVPDSSAPESKIMRIEMLGGLRVQGDKFYRLEGETEPRNLGQLQQALRSEKQGDKLGLGRIEIVIYEDSVALEHHAVRDLEKWAKQNNLTVSISQPAGTAP